MSYVESTLTTGENIVARAKPSLLRFVPDMLFIASSIAGLAILAFAGSVAPKNGGEPASVIQSIGCCACVLLPFVGLSLFRIAVTMLTTELAVTNKRIVAKYGFVSRSVVELRLEKVESVRIEQSVLGRIFDYGSVLLAGAGAATPIPGIAAPMIFRQACMQTIEAQSSVARPAP